MTEIIITVRGSAWAEHTPERARVAFTISTRGPERAPVTEQASSAMTVVRDLVERRHDASRGPVTRWSMDALTVSSDRHWVRDDEHEIVHRARVSGEIEVSELDALAGLLDDLTAVPAVNIDGIDWSLTEARELEATESVRQAAIADALGKATSYAAALGHHTVIATAIADPGMLGVGGGGSPRTERAMAMSVGGGAPSFELRPEPIVVEASVDARFSAR